MLDFVSFEFTNIRTLSIQDSSCPFGRAFSLMGSLVESPGQTFQPSIHVIKPSAKVCTFLLGMLFTRPKRLLLDHI